MIPSDALLKLLRCPETGQQLKFVPGESLTESAPASRIDEGALVRKDGLRGYPIRNGLPILLADEAFEIEIPEQGFQAI